MSAKHADSFSQRSRCSKKSEGTGDSSGRRKNQRDDKDLAEGFRDLSIGGNKKTLLYKAVPSNDQLSKNHRPAHTLTRSHEQNSSRTTTAPHQHLTEPVRGNPRVTTSIAETRAASSQPRRSKRLQGRPPEPLPQKISGGVSKKGLERGRKGGPPPSAGPDKKPKPAAIPYTLSNVIVTIVQNAPLASSWGFYLHCGGEDQYLNILSSTMPGVFQYDEIQGAGPGHYGPNFNEQFIAHIAPGNRDRCLEVVRSQSLLDQLGHNDPDDWCHDVLERLRDEGIIPQNINPTIVQHTVSTGL